QDVGGFVRDCLLRCCPLPVPGDDVSRSWVTIGGTLDAFDVRRPVVESFWRGYGEIRAEADHDLALRAVAFAGWSLFARVLAAGTPGRQDRKSTRLNSSHVSISYAVVCLQNKSIHNTTMRLV